MNLEHQISEQEMATLWALTNARRVHPQEFLERTTYTFPNFHKRFPTACKRAWNAYCKTRKVPHRKHKTSPPYIFDPLRVLLKNSPEAQAYESGFEDGLRYEKPLPADERKLKEQLEKYARLGLCSTSEEGVAFGQKQRSGQIMGESLDKECWIVLWDGRKSTEALHKSFVTRRMSVAACISSA